MPASHRPHQGKFGQLGTLIEGSSDAHAHYDRRTGVGPRLFHRRQDELPDTLFSVGGLEHLDGAHILAAEALGRKEELQSVSRHHLIVDHRRGIISGVLPMKYRVPHHGFSEIALPVALRHALLERFLQRLTHDMELLSQPHPKYRHARILTQGHGPPGGDFIIADELVQNTPGQGLLLLVPSLPQALHHVCTDAAVGLHHHIRHRLADQRRIQLSHGSVLHMGLHGLGHYIRHAHVEGAGNDALPAQLLRGDPPGDSIGGGDHHFLRDP